MKKLIRKGQRGLKAVIDYIRQTVPQDFNYKQFGYRNLDDYLKAIRAKAMDASGSSSYLSRDAYRRRFPQIMSGYSEAPYINFGTDYERMTLPWLQGIKPQGPSVSEVVITSTKPQVKRDPNKTVWQQLMDMSETEGEKDIVKAMQEEAMKSKTPIVVEEEYISTRPQKPTKPQPKRREYRLSGSDMQPRRASQAVEQNDYRWDFTDDSDLDYLWKQFNQ